MNRWLIAGVLTLCIAFTVQVSGCGKNDQSNSNFKGVTVNPDGSLGPPPGVIKKGPSSAHP